IMAARANTQITEALATMANLMARDNEVNPDQIFIVLRWLILIKSSSYHNMIHRGHDGMILNVIVDTMDTMERRKSPKSS
ncbi:hypothetical protein A2U01_0066426, partial [Trifolium medium]|nr:hypothetical protein [Trifolium medium]